MDKRELLKLAERVEALSGRSRVANALIWKACKPDEYHQWEGSSRGMLSKGLSEDHKKGELHERAKAAAPNFTGSLDTAMTLVPAMFSGQMWLRFNEGERHKPHAAIWSHDDGNGKHSRVNVEAKASTPALALCAAALRALAKEDS